MKLNLNVVFKHDPNLWVQDTCYVNGQKWFTEETMPDDDLQEEMDAFFQVFTETHKDFAAIVLVEAILDRKLIGMELPQYLTHCGYLLTANAEPWRLETALLLMRTQEILLSATVEETMRTVLHLETVNRDRNPKYDPEDFANAMGLFEFGSALYVFEHKKECVAEVHRKYPNLLF